MTAIIYLDEVKIQLFQLNMNIFSFRKTTFELVTHLFYLLSIDKIQIPLIGNLIADLLVLYFLPISSVTLLPRISAVTLLVMYFLPSHGWLLRQENNFADFSIWISSDELIYNIAIVDILDNDTVDRVGGLMLNHVLQPVIQKKRC